MTDRAIVRTARATVTAGGLLAVGGTVVSFASGEIELWWKSFSAVSSIMALCFGAFVWLVIPRQPRNPVVWTMAAASLAGVYVAGIARVGLLIDGDATAVRDPSWVPADSEPSVAWTVMVSEAASDLALFLPITFGLLLFPDGSLPSPRWRPVAAFAAVGIVVLTISHAAWFRPSNASESEGPVLLASLTVTLVAAALSLWALVRRFRSSTGDSRQQFKWIVWGACVCVPAIVIPGFLPDSATRSDLVILVVTMAVAVLATSYGIAVGRYRLYDVDVIISRTVLFAGLALFISGVYVGLVVGIGAAFGGASLWLSVFATAFVAVVFEPFRVRLQGWANRLAYGRRASPYEVLAQVTGQLAESEPEQRLLIRLASYLRDGTGAERATVWLAENGSFRSIATAPDDESSRVLSSPGDLAGTQVPIEYEGEMLGALTVEARPGVSMSAVEIQLVEDLAGSAALVVHKLRLDDALTAKAQELQQSRRRLLGAQDDERHRLEQVLRDSVERQLTALRGGLGEARRLAVDEGSRPTAELIDQMTDDAEKAIDQIRSLARGIYPPLLDESGLEAAISELAAQCPLDTDVAVDLARRLPGIIEGAVYFCVAEALTNASKYAMGPISVEVSDRTSDLSFTVADVGPGFDPVARSQGSGLANMTDRLESLGGRLTIRSGPASTTTIHGTLPVPAGATDLQPSRPR